MSVGTNLAPVSDANTPYRWQRRSPTERAARWLFYLGSVVLIVWSLQTIDIVWPWVWTAPAQLRDMASRMYPPSLERLGPILLALLDTINIAVLGTMVAVVLAMPVAYVGARNVTPAASLYWLARVIVVASRSVDTLIWAMVLVAIFGPGPLAGVLAVAFRSIGFLGKLVAEAIEEINWGPVEALQSVGASRSHVLVYAVIPQVLPSFWAVTILRWDVNIRESTVLGLVGAGGIGLLFQWAMESFRWSTVSFILITIVITALFGELITAMLRRRIL